MNQNLNSDEFLEIYLKQISKIPKLTKNEEHSLAILAAKGDNDSKDKLVTANLKFVVSIAKEYTGRGSSIMDLINQGNLGLIKAADKFNPDIGIRFISYAVWWIKQNITSITHQNMWSLRLPENKVEKLRYIKKSNDILQQKLNKKVASSEIAINLDMERREVDLLLNAKQTPYSLYSKYFNNDIENELIDVIEDNKLKPLVENINDEYINETISSLLKNLTKTERFVIILRFGLYNQKPCSLKEIGDKIVLCKERIRQIEVRAIRKLSTFPECGKLKIFLN